MSAGFALLKRILHETAGLAIDDDKAYLIEDRLRPVLRAAKLRNLDELAGRLQLDRRSDLAHAVTEALTINETSFFRDRSLFTDFGDRVIPDLIRARQERRRLRIWCAGCSSGQEPYSLAMIIDEHTRRLSGWQVEILATDISRPMIENAKRGLYSQFEVQRGLPVAMLLRYFRRDGDHWQISDYLRAKVAFRTFNLMADPAELGGFDVIFCRNVLLYFDVTVKRRVLANLSSVLAPDGRLVLGGAESVGGLTDILHAEAANFVFTKSLVPEARQLRAS